MKIQLENYCTDCTPPHPMNLCPDCTHETFTDEAMAHHMNTEHGYDVQPGNWWTD